jgi:hypothetical protein
MPSDWMAIDASVRQILLVVIAKVMKGLKFYFSAG